MGVFDFVKNAGAKIFGKEEEVELLSEAEVAEIRDAALAELQAENEAKMASRLTNVVWDFGIGIEDMNINVSGDMATISGVVQSQMDLEKIVLLIGNHEGIASVDCLIEVNEPEPEATFYTVVRGDSLSKIAKAHYGNASKYPAIFEANKPMLSDPNKIYPGQVLRIPAEETLNA